jgi:hypothetical protein
MPYLCPYCGSTYDSIVCSPCDANHNVKITEAELAWLEATGAKVTNLQEKRAEFEAWLKTKE